jgi:hypothetical protein
MIDLVTRLRAWHTPGETITGDVALYLEAADRIAALEMALVELSQTNGSHSDGADASRGSEGYGPAKDHQTSPT